MSNRVRVSNIEPFINKSNSERINYPSKIHDWKMFLKNNPTISPDILDINKNEKCLAIFHKLIKITKNNWSS